MEWGGMTKASMLRHGVCSVPVAGEIITGDQRSFERMKMFWFLGTLEEL